MIHCIDAKDCYDWAFVGFKGSELCHEMGSSAYNETVAYEYFPLSKEQVLERGWRWNDDDQEKNYRRPIIDIPDAIKDIPEDICKKILTCEETVLKKNCIKKSPPSLDEDFSRNYNSIRNS